MVFIINYSKCVSICSNVDDIDIVIVIRVVVDFSLRLMLFRIKSIYISVVFLRKGMFVVF